ncbi:MAG: hypothetical protein ABJB11_03135 [Ferruginibacter sp.]
MKKLILSCKRATYLISLKEEGKLSFRQRMQLRTHLSICSMCKKFEKQTAFISGNAKHSPQHADVTLDQNSKDKMKTTLKNIVDEK